MSAFPRNVVVSAVENARMSPLSSDAVDAMRFRVLHELLSAPRTLMSHGEVCLRYTIDIPAHLPARGRIVAWLDRAIESVP